MLIPFKEIVRKYNMKISGVIQVGVHWAEEHDDYLAEGIDKFVYIEPCKDAFNILLKKFEHLIIKGETEGNLVRPLFKNMELFHCACGENERNDVMYVSNDNQGQSNSLLKPDKHLQQHPEVVFNEAEIVSVKRLDYLPFERSDYNLLVTDCQGYDGHVMLGATETLKHIDYICMEVNRDSVYEGNMLIDNVDKLLSDFQRVETEWVGNWGDSWYIRKTLL